MKKETLATEDQINNLVRKQTVNIENKIMKIKKSGKGRCGKVFEMRDVVAGPKKKGQDAQAIKDPKTGNMVVSSSEIKRVTLEYCLDVLKNNEPEEEYKELVESKEEAVKILMKRNDREFSVTEESFKCVLKKLKIKNKRSYDLPSQSWK